MDQIVTSRPGARDSIRSKSFYQDDYGLQESRMVNCLKRMVKKGRKREREIIQFALSKEYQSKLNSEGWCLSENKYDKYIGKIKEVEPEILRILKEREKR